MVNESWEDDHEWDFLIGLFLLNTPLLLNNGSMEHFEIGVRVLSPSKRSPMASDTNCEIEFDLPFRLTSLTFVTGISSLQAWLSLWPLLFSQRDVWGLPLSANSCFPLVSTSQRMKGQPGLFHPAATLVLSCPPCLENDLALSSLVSSVSWLTNPWPHKAPSRTLRITQGS